MWSIVDVKMFVNYFVVLFFCKIVTSAEESAHINVCCTPANRYKCTDTCNCIRVEESFLGHTDHHLPLEIPVGVRTVKVTDQQLSVGLLVESVEQQITMCGMGVTDIMYRGQLKNCSKYPFYLIFDLILSTALA